MTPTPPVANNLAQSGYMPKNSMILSHTSIVASLRRAGNGATCAFRPPVALHAACRCRLTTLIRFLGQVLMSGTMPDKTLSCTRVPLGPGASLWPEIAPRLVSVLRPWQPLHGARVVPPAFAQGHQVVHLTLHTAGRLGIRVRAFRHSTGIALDLSVAVPRTTLALDRAAASAEGAAMATPRGGGGRRPPRARTSNARPVSTANTSVVTSGMRPREAGMRASRSIAGVWLRNSLGDCIGKSGRRGRDWSAS